MANQLTSEQIDSFLARHKDPADARKFLQDAGLIDENGELAEPYRPERITLLSQKNFDELQERLSKAARVLTKPAPWDNEDAMDKLRVASADVSGVELDPDWVKKTDQQHPITPPPELVQEWAHMLEQHTDTDVFTQASRWGADQQLEQDAKWLDTNAVFTRNLTITPSGDALRKAMLPKLPSLKEQAINDLATAYNKDQIDDTTYENILRALKQLK